MKTPISGALDDCLKRISSGDTIDTSLAGYPHFHEQLKPLLQIARLITTQPAILPSPQFRRASKRSLVMVLRKEYAPHRTVPSPSYFIKSAYDYLVTACKSAAQTIVQYKEISLASALILVLIIGGSFITYLPANFFSPQPAIAAPSHVSTLSGNVEIQIAGSKTWVQVDDGMPLQANCTIRTSAQSSGQLTFFSGSTLTLEPETTVEIQQLEGSTGGPSVIVVKQWIGKTLSRVIKLLDPGSRYEILTPSAHALVRGTVFSVEVNQIGLTTVQTAEGLVSVRAQGQEVSVPPGQETVVNPGAAPSAPSQATSGFSGERGSSNQHTGNDSNNSNAGNNSDKSNTGGNSDKSNTGGNSDKSNTGGNSDNSNAGGNSGGGNSGGNSGGGNAGGNSGGGNSGGGGGNSGGGSGGGNSGGGGGGNSGGGGGGNSGGGGGNSGGGSGGGNSGGGGGGNSGGGGGNSGGGGGGNSGGGGGGNSGGGGGGNSGGGGGGNSGGGGGGNSGGGGGGNSGGGGSG